MIRTLRLSVLQNKSETKVMMTKIDDDQNLTGD